ncbi:MAG: alkaline phosphatase family protein [Saprospiraceae bacterium]|nr:alkaline phosphatase family protein [Saprospiraceae bacterium]
MKNIILTVILGVCLICQISPSVWAQNPMPKKLISGPMLGYIEHREVQIWLEVAQSVQSVDIVYHAAGSTKMMKAHVEKERLGRVYNPVKLTLEGLEMNTVYNYQILLDGEKQSSTFPFTFRTKKLWEWREDAPNFTFLLGSCFYLNDPAYDRPGKPYGQDPRILETMGNMPTDFMLWLGDNLYLREADFSSASGIAYRYSTNFRHPAMQKLRGTRANYAIWDDHDYGPNDSDGKFELKEVSLAHFKRYWANKTFGEADNAGAYHKFKWSDCDFFCMDDRFYRSANTLPDSLGGKPNPNKQFYGKKQLDWLKNGLISSEASFKFIVTGGQVLNPLSDRECFMFYPSEWSELMSFIVENKIEGVVFLSGDQHYSEMIKRQIAPDFYPFYDFTCSPVTSGVKDINKTKAFNNPLRVEGSLLIANNFGKISVSGKKGERKLTFETFDIDGKNRWQFTLNQKDLTLSK